MTPFTAMSQKKSRLVRRLTCLSSLIPETHSNYCIETCQVSVIQHLLLQANFYIATSSNANIGLINVTSHFLLFRIISFKGLHAATEYTNNQIMTNNEWTVQSDAAVRHYKFFLLNETPNSHRNKSN